MTKFKSGPARGQTLMLKRTPILLRVTETLGKFDALDQIEDTPKAEEKLYAYHLTGAPGHCHLNFGGGRGGFYPIAEYELCSLQPTDAEMRDSQSWRKWCETNVQKVHTPF